MKAPAEAETPEAPSENHPGKEKKDSKSTKGTKDKKAKDSPKENPSKGEPAAKADKPAASAPKARKPKADPEVIRQRKEEKARVSRRRTRQIIGFALSILIVVGAVSIVSWGVDTARSLMDSDEERQEYLKLYEPMVWFDILPFESVSMVDENNIKEISIWGVLNEKQDLLERNEYGEPLVPVSEIEQYAARMFGPDFRFAVYETFSTPTEGLTYTYDEATQIYTAPVTGLMPRYLASVVAVEREGGGVRRVVMGYVSTRTGDDQIIATPDYEHPAKYMDYMLRRDGGEYYLYAIQNNTTYVPPAAASQPESTLQAEEPLPDESVPAVAEAVSEAPVESEPEPTEEQAAE